LCHAEEQPEVLSAKLDKKWLAGHIVGPFSFSPFANFFSSPLGIIPKKTPGDLIITFIGFVGNGPTGGKH